jgi:hypothetical protein
VYSPGEVRFKTCVFSFGKIDAILVCTVMEKLDTRLVCSVLEKLDRRLVCSVLKNLDVRLKMVQS